MFWCANCILGVFGNLDRMGTTMLFLYCVSKNVGAYMLDAEEPWGAVAQRRWHQSVRRDLTKGATGQINDRRLCWSDLLGRSGNAAECYWSGWDIFLMARVSWEPAGSPPKLPSITRA
jgi:hypothetical protein